MSLLCSTTNFPSVFFGIFVYHTTFPSVLYILKNETKQLQFTAVVMTVLSADILV